MSGTSRSACGALPPAVGGAVGVLLGGVLTSYLSWSWIFFVNLPVGAAILVVTPWLVSESRAALAHRHFDVSGATSITAGLMVLVYAITRTSEHGWSDGVTIGLLATAAALIAAFVGIEARSPAPLLPLRIFRLRTLSAANAVMLTVGATAFAQFFLLTLYLQEVLRYSAIETGVAFIAITVTIVVVSNVGQALTTRLGARPVLSAGLLLTAAGGALYAQVPADGHYFWNVVPGVDLERDRARALVRAGDDRRPYGRAAGRCRRCVRADQHKPADRRLGRAGRRDHDRRHRDEPLRPRATRCSPSAARRSRTGSRSPSTCWPAWRWSERRSLPSSSSRSRRQLRRRSRSRPSSIALEEAA